MSQNLDHFADATVGPFAQATGPERFWVVPVIAHLGEVCSLDQGVSIVEFDGASLHVLFRHLLAALLLTLCHGNLLSGYFFLPFLAGFFFVILVALRVTLRFGGTCGNISSLKSLSDGSRFFIRLDLIPEILV